MKKLIAQAATALLSPPRIGRETSLDLMERISAITHLVISSEHLCRPGTRAKGGLNNWDITRESLRHMGPRTRAVMDVVARPRVTTSMHAARVAAALVLLAPGRNRAVRGGADGVVAATSLLTYARHHYGTDGSDQVSFLVQTAATIARAAGSRSRIVDASLWAVSMQSALSYAASGLVKLAGPTWRRGLALEGILRTLTYGDPHAWRLARRFPRSARLMSKGVLVMECTFPLAYVAGGRLAKSYIAGVAGFHVANARIMGLGRFLPSFVSMHPAVLYTASRRATSNPKGGPRRDDSMVAAVAAYATLVAGSAAVTRRRNNRIVDEGRGDERYLETRDGNRLAFRRWGSDDPAAPVYVFENGMVSTCEHWDWIAGQVARTATVVTYNRSGYGASTHRKGTAQDIDDLADHATELIDHVSDGRPVVLVGHSLGGYIALLAANRTSASVRAVALVDTSHPDELRMSEKQAAGQHRLTEMFPIMAHSLDLGLGMLLKDPEFGHRLPAAARPTAIAQYRTGRLWHAGRREWAATEREFNAGKGLPQIDVPVLVLSAQHTIEDDEVQGDLHRAMADASPFGRFAVVDAAEHDSILTAERSAGVVTDHLLTFVRDCVDRVADAHNSAKAVGA